MTATIEETTKAAQALTMAAGDLCAALATAGAVQGLALMDLARDASALARRAEALRLAMAEDHARTTGAA
jgi:hypothetical protein